MSRRQSERLRGASRANRAARLAWRWRGACLFLLWSVVGLPAIARGNGPAPGVPADSLTSRRVSASTALLIAIGPGALVHGAGHLYLGDVRTARWLALSEAAGYAAMFTAHAHGADSGDGTGSGAIVYGVGAGLFFGSWLYDILAAPAAARARGTAGAPASDARWEWGALPHSRGLSFGMTRRF